jgi:hypothetical protein
MPGSPPPGEPLRVLVLGAEWTARPFVDDLVLGLAERGLAITLVSGAGAPRPPAPIAVLPTVSARRPLYADPLGAATAAATVAAAPGRS